MNTFFALNEAESHLRNDTSKLDPVFYEPIKKASNEFGADVMLKVPKEGEVRLLGNRHKECLYYTAGVDICKKNINQRLKSSFLPCKETLDAMFRCYTNDTEGTEYHQIRSVGQPYMQKFLGCMFVRGSKIEDCMEHFENSIRAIYRNGDHKLIDY